MRSYDFHECISLIELARPLARARFCMVSLPAYERLWPWLKGGARKALRPLLVIWQHLLLVLALYGQKRGQDLVLVRDFLTLPLLVVVWLALPLRRRVVFVVVQNLQRATTRAADRFAFRLFCRLGLRLAFLEGTDGIEVLGIQDRPDRFLCLPHPVLPPPAAKRDHERPVVGVVGVYRPEKGMESLLAALEGPAREGRFDLLVGSPNYAALQARLAAFSAPVRAVDTTRGEDYEQALQSCDVVAINYNREDYYFRGSGVITNAVECGACMVCPDFPVFRRQVLEPAPVGELFPGAEDIAPAVRRALERLPGLRANIPAYLEHRSAAATARRIDAFARAAGVIPAEA